MLIIEGVDMPTPTDYDIDDEEISKADRNANAYMLKEQVAFKYKLNLKWAMLTPEETKKLSRVKKKNSFNVSFIDLENERVTKEFYAGTLSARGMQYKDGKILYWKDVRMNIIER
ncbi:hypothetical protein KQI42_15925 [Tissierella sp. MSJ-40]|uniref:Uncharacterized protein n=1 Tax=Tissierella simiarum TaxID=2841534 RepID=A0ABS6E9R7_9FIRM|nr:hypothetical protein [Tissierella simiarum]MBU5439504.1 hypothetical protein [Tissierella simiarum]